MKKLVLMACICCMLSISMIGQNAPRNIRMQAVQSTIDAYNAQDYEKMKAPWGLLGKLLITQKALKREFGPTYKRYGKARIDTVTFSSKYEYTAQLRYEKDPPNRGFLKFIFNENDKR